DNEAEPIQNDIRISSGEKFDFIFTRGLLVPGAGLPSDTAPLLTSSSGSYSFGFGFSIPLKKAAAIRFEPRLTWNSLNFQQTPEKTFPTDSGNVFVYERVRSFYGEMPLGIRFNLARNDEEKVRLFTELGFSAGYLFSSASKARTGTGIDRVTVKRHDVWGMNRTRLGPYFRFGTNWIAFHASYRMTNVFNDNKRYLDPKSQTAVPFPHFPKLEMGFCVML
ncbi:MAG: outer membrane beta-barrel protein, partial [Ilumatobacteraceae bacterium]|nr:outer membrane beta-barrel protein [Ilumatobacteraceae bacterium]